MKYHTPKIVSENIYDVKAGGISIFAVCYCDYPYSSWVKVQNSNQTCKSAK